jgi:hypothetical protein
MFEMNRWCVTSTDSVHQARDEQRVVRFVVMTGSCFSAYILFFSGH